MSVSLRILDEQALAARRDEWLPYVNEIAAETRVDPARVVAMAEGLEIRLHGAFDEHDRLIGLAGAFAHLDARGVRWLHVDWARGGTWGMWRDLIPQFEEHARDQAFAGLVLLLPMAAIEEATGLGFTPPHVVPMSKLLPRSVQ